MNEKYTYQGHRKEVAEEFIKLIQEGTAPWQKPWDPGKMAEYNISLMPRNAISGNFYKGMNSMHLLYIGMVKKYEDPRWCTFKQASNNKWKIKKGAKSVPIEFWITRELKEIEDEKTGEKKKEWFDLPKNEFKFRVYRVFNACDIEGIPPIKTLAEAPTLKWQPIDEAEKVLKNSGAEIFYDNTSAFYKPSDDTIHLPPKMTFDKQEDFYHTAFHELTHWTGAEKRLNRLSKVVQFGSPDYAREELVADIGGFLTCIKLNMPYKPLQNKTASYLDNWLNALNKNPNELFKAVGQADTASQYLLNLSNEREKAIKSPSLEINNNAEKVPKKSIEELEQKYHLIEKFGKLSKKTRDIQENKATIQKDPNEQSNERINTIISTNLRKNLRSTSQIYLFHAKKYLSQNNNVWDNNFDNKIINDLLKENKNPFDIQFTLSKYSPACYSKKELSALNKTIKEKIQHNVCSR